MPALLIRFRVNLARSKKLLLHIKFQLQLFAYLDIYEMTNRFNKTDLTNF